MDKNDKYDPHTIEPEILKYWQEQDIYAAAKARNEGKKSWYFLDGPPYTSGSVHLGTAWNKSLKDCVLRYRRMAGFDIWDRAGYDMHGLPTEHATEKKLGIKDKAEIPSFGIGKFTAECRKLALENLYKMNDDFKRLGVWMDFDNAYMSINNSFMEGEWWLVKKAHEKGRLYEGVKAMHWCSHCGTALAKHELEYKAVEEDSIFLKFPIVGRDKEFLIIWTTTPWTIPYNMGVMVNPGLEYVRAKVGDEVWILAKALAGMVVQAVANKKMEIISEMKGDQLKGIIYTPPFAEELRHHFDELRKTAKKMHCVVMSEEYVDTSAGSGLVHMAPGCGPEDFEVGHKEGIPAFNNLDERGRFPDSMGRLSGLVAKKDDPKIIKMLEESGSLIATTKVEHDYAHCWRCKHPIIYKTTKQWFFKIEDLREKMRELNRSIKWVPDWAGNRQFDSWLENLRDNGITRQRYWGTPLPIWRCEKCAEYVVVGSIAELKQLAGSVPEDLHIPHIDSVTIKCKCGGTMKRIPDILDVWIDAGTTSWACLDYPQRTDLFEKLWPADFILEGKDQIRGWFNLLFVASMLGFEKACYKAVYMHGFVQDSQGRKMSKSLGNYILPEEVISQQGADTFRYYCIGGCLPGIDLNYNPEDVKIKRRNLDVLWNLHKFLIESARALGKNPAEIKNLKIGIEEKYILSKLNSTIDKTTELYEGNSLDQVPVMLEEFYLDLSRTYIKLIRDKAATGTDEEKETVLAVIYRCLFEFLKMFSTIAPFISEKIYLNLKQEFSLSEQSISLYHWPKEDTNAMDKRLEAKMEDAKDMITTILNARERCQIGVRWPVKYVVIVSPDESVRYAAKDLAELIKKQANVKRLAVQATFSKIKLLAQPNIGAIGKDFGTHSGQIIGTIATKSAETILKAIEKKGEYAVDVDGEKYLLKKEHIEAKRGVPANLVEGEFRHGFIYLDKELDEELLAEGFAREITRRVQELRKNAGLKKPDRIRLCIVVDSKLEKAMANQSASIAEKVGAAEITISSQKPAKEYQHSSKDKIKNKEIEVFFDVV